MAVFSRSFFKKAESKKVFLKKHWKKHLFLHLGFILLMLGLISFALYQLVQHMTVGLDTLRTQEIWQESYVDLDLYVYRDEEVLTANGQVFAYHVADGEKVGVGKTVASAYACQAGQDVANIQAELTDLANRMSGLKSSVGQGDPTQIGELSDAIDQDYLAFLQAVQVGDLAQAGACAERMEGYLNVYDALMAGQGEASGVGQSLQTALSSLIQTLTHTDTLKVPENKSGHFYYHTDGYESLFDDDTVMTMTPEDFLGLTTASAVVFEQAIAGKMVYKTTWYAATYVELADVGLFYDRLDEDFDFVCSDGSGITLPMTLVRLEPSEDGNGVLLVFKSQAMPKGFDFPRSFSARVKANSVGGYRIPTEALLERERDGEIEYGVYVLEGNVVEYRKVMLKSRHDSYIMAETYDAVRAILDTLDEAEREKIESDGYAYLNLNDKIITRGTGLYEGKIIS